MDCIIVHGCPSDKEKAMDEKTRIYDKHWIPWIKKKLCEETIMVAVPLMPEPWAPNYESWKNRFDKLEINENSILVGHSCGCAFLVRWLGETKKKIKKLILVAPAITNKRKDDWESQEFYDFKINKNLLKNIGHIILFKSDDDDASILESCKIYENNLNPKVIELKNHGHFTLGDMGTEEFPELLNEILDNNI